MANYLRFLLLDLLICACSCRLCYFCLSFVYWFLLCRLPAVSCLQFSAVEVSPHTESVVVLALSPSVFDHLHSAWKTQVNAHDITAIYRLQLVVYWWEKYITLLSQNLRSYMILLEKPILDSQITEFQSKTLCFIFHFVFPIFMNYQELQILYFPCCKWPVFLVVTRRTL